MGAGGWGVAGGDGGGGSDCGEMKCGGEKVLYVGRREIAGRSWCLRGKSTFELSEVEERERCMTLYCRKCEENVIYKVE